MPRPGTLGCRLVPREFRCTICLVKGPANHGPPQALGLGGCLVSREFRCTICLVKHAAREGLPATLGSGWDVSRMERSPLKKRVKRAGVAQLVEREPSKLDVASSSLVSRCQSFWTGPLRRDERGDADGGAARGDPSSSSPAKRAVAGITLPALRSAVARFIERTNSGAAARM